MALGKFKICPACSERNPPALLECKKCETDLTGVKVVDDAILAAQADVAQVPAASRENSHLVKLCDCGLENLPQARKCTACGEDLSDVRATEGKPAAAVPVASAVFRALDGSFCYSITKPVTVIGRESEMSDYLKERIFVSRKHAKITLANGEFYIENLSGTNHTFVNNTLIPNDAPTLLKNGDEVGFGGKMINGERQAQAAYFLIEVSA